MIRLKFRTPDNKKIIISNECSGRDAVFYRFNEKPTYWFKVVGKTTVKVTAPTLQSQRKETVCNRISSSVFFKE